MRTIRSGFQFLVAMLLLGFAGLMPAAFAGGLIIATQPQSQTVVAGKNASFNVVAGSLTGVRLTLTYQWFKGDQAIPGATKSSYVIAKTKATDAGSYHVVVGGGGDSITSANAVLSIIVPPIIATQPASQSVRLGGHASFRVVSTNTTSAQYQWRKGGKPIANATQSTLEIQPVQASDAGAYSVVVSNAAGQVTSATATLSVGVPPTITAQPRGQTVLAGRSVTFTVTATGTAPLAYQWLRNGTNVPGATKSSYSIAKTKATDAAVYSVLVRNAVDFTTSLGAALIVTSPPVITMQPHTLTVDEGGEAVFQVTAEGTAPLTYQWLKNGQPMVGQTSASLVLEGVSSGPVMSYSVVVRNSYGNVTSAAAKLTVVPSRYIGPWVILEFSTPSMLTTEQGGDGQVTGLNGASFRVEGGGANFHADGSLNGTLENPFTGRYQSLPGGLFGITGSASNDTFGLVLFINMGVDFMVGLEPPSGDSDRQSLLILQHPPTSLSSSQLAGFWNMFRFQTPAEVSLNPGGGGQLDQLQGGQNFETQQGTVSVSSSGGLSGNFGGAFHGSITSTANGQASVVVTDSTGKSQGHTLQVNAGKDTMLLLQSQPDPSQNKQSLTIFQRAPSTLAVADLAGFWNVASFETPSQIAFNAGSASLNGGDNFSTQSGSMTVTADGKASGDVSGAFTATITVGAHGQINANVSNADGTSQRTVFINAAKDRMISITGPSNQAGNSQHIDIFQRAPAPVAPARAGN